MIAIVWHSRTGASRTMAEAIHGATEGQSLMVRACDATAELMLDAQGYVFVCPENLASMSGEMKEFFDRNYYPLLGKIEGRPYATAIAAGSDGTGALAQIDRIVTGWRLKRIADPIIVCLAAQTPEEILAPKTVASNELAVCAELGQAFAEGLAIGIF